MFKAKNKKGVILLLVLVVGIWGTISFKIVKHLYFPDSIELNGSGFVAKDTKKKTEVLRYSFAYADPFLKNRRYSIAPDNLERAVSSSFAIKEQPTPTVKPKIAEPSGLKFMGWASNTHKTLKEALVEQGGRIHILEVGEELGDYTVVQVFADSLIVSREGSRFCLRRMQ